TTFESSCVCVLTSTPPSPATTFTTADWAWTVSGTSTESLAPTVTCIRCVAGANPGPDTVISYKPGCMFVRTATPSSLVVAVGSVVPLSTDLTVTVAPGTTAPWGSMDFTVT